MIVRRARTADGDGGPQPVTVVLTAAPGPAAAQRLAGIAEAGRDLGVAVILLGNWPHGTTCHITADSLISSVTPPRRGPGRDPGLPPGSRGPGRHHRAAGPGPRDRRRRWPGRTRPAGTRTAASPRRTRGSRARPGEGVTPPGAAAAGRCRARRRLRPAGTPVRISVLGPLQITAGGREIGTGLRKARELLAFLAVHGADGATGEAISEALWPGTPPGHGTRQRNIALRKARDLLRGAAGLPAPMWITLTAGRYRLDPALAGTDLQQFQAALEAARTARDDQARLAALRQAVACYRGPLADGAGYDWAEPYAETARRRALDAWARIAQILQPVRPRPGPSGAGGRPDPRPVQRVHLPADHAAAGRSGPPGRRPAHPGPAGNPARRPRPYPGRQHPQARRRPAGHRATARPPRRPAVSVSIQDAAGRSRANRIQGAGPAEPGAAGARSIQIAAQPIREM